MELKLCMSHRQVDQQQRKCHCYMILGKGGMARSSSQRCQVVIWLYP